MRQLLVKLQTQCILWPWYLGYIIIISLNLNTPFFWDKDLIISRQAWYYYENGFSIVLPDTMNTGFFPALSLLLAYLWKIFGIHLTIGHLIMVPFALLLIQQVYKFLLNLKNDKGFAFFTLTLVLIDPTLLSQLVVVSTDLMLASFFFLALNAILKNRRLLLGLALFGLSLTHFRGLLIAGALVFLDGAIRFLVERQRFTLRNFVMLVLPYLPMVLFQLLFFWLHYQQAGWILKHEDSPWSMCYERVNLSGLLFNLGILGWRFLDIGRVFVWLFLFLALYRIDWKRLVTDAGARLVIGSSLLLGMIIFPSMLMYRMLASHRYLIPMFILLTIITCYVLFSQGLSAKFKRWAFVLMFLGLFTGNFWIYPDKIAKGWDATIAHLPYHNLLKQMVSYIDKAQIDFIEIGSEIPNTQPLKYSLLNNDERYFARADFKRHRYILYSNIYNMFSDEEIDELRGQWECVIDLRCVQVKMQLYRNPSLP